jgi:hypothetical protein
MHMKVSRVASICLAVLAMAGTAAAQSSSGTLTVTATVQPSIELTFETNTGGVPLTGSTTNAATLPFGNISAFATLGQPNAVRTIDLAGSTYTVSSLFNVRVTKANTGTSPNYTLAAGIDALDAYTWRVNAVTLSTTAAPVASLQGYDSVQNHTLYLTVPFAAASGAISKVVSFTATAN